MSVIRNTNTKIIMRLPDEEDRQLVGKAANVSEDQIRELAKLPTGVAAVYQNNWIEPILCQVTYKKTGEFLYRTPTIPVVAIEQENRRRLIYNLVQKCAGEKLDMSVGQIVKMIVGMSIMTSTKIGAIKASTRNGNCTKSDIASVLATLVFTPEVEKYAEETESIEEWKDAIVCSSESLIEDLGENDQNLVVECIPIDLIARKCRPPEYLNKWHNYIEGTVI